MDDAGLTETKHYDEKTDSLTVKTVYNSSDTVDANKKARDRTPRTGKYNTSNGGLVHALRIEEGDIIRLKNMGYNLYSPDKDEFRRALLYIQQNEPWHMVVDGKPFAKNRSVWV